MGASAPEQKDAMGSGYTSQRSLLPQDIRNKSQNAFRTGLSNAMSATANLGDYSTPTLSNIGKFNPSSLSLQYKKSGYNLGNKGLSNIVQGQLSRTLADNAGIANAQNQRLASTIGSSNPRLLAALQSQNTLQSSLNAGPAQLAALEQQRGYDTQEAQLDLQRMEQANQALLADRQAQERAYGLNADATQTNNSAALARFQADRAAAAQDAQLNQSLLSSLGQGLISTSGQEQQNFTLKDIRKYMKNPGLYKDFFASSGGAAFKPTNLRMARSGILGA